MAKAKGIYKRGNIYWIRYAGLDGKIRFESGNSTSFRDAQDMLIQRKKEIMEGKEPIPVKRIANHSFNELADHYITWAERQRAFDRKKYFIQDLINTFGNCPLRRFSPMLIEEYQTKFITNGKAPATANRHLATLKHMMTKAVEWEMVEEEVLKKVRKVKFLHENNRRLRYLSKEECQSLINVCSPHLRPIVITALNTGMRKEEILSLEWEKHIDLKHGFILLDVTKNGERREIPINQTLKDTLQRIPRRLDSTYVFIDDNGKRYKYVNRSFKTGCRRAGIKDFRFHDLRHTFASHLVMAGVDLTTISRLLGHKDIKMTLRYSHLAPSHMVKAVDILDSAINGKPTIQKLYNFAKKEVIVNA
ncbi:MAG: site-specific integrase [Nitrospinae bacterium]|nr:site-specific integrase [Nitrospinota bacterium]